MMEKKPSSVCSVGNTYMDVQVLLCVLLRSTTEPITLVYLLFWYTCFKHDTAFLLICYTQFHVVRKMGIIWRVCQVCCSTCRQACAGAPLCVRRTRCAHVPCVYMRAVCIRCTSACLCGVYIWHLCGVRFALPQGLCS